MVSPQVKVGGRYCSHSPLRLAGKLVPLVVTGRAGDYLVSVLVHRPVGQTLVCNYNRTKGGFKMLQNYSCVYSNYFELRPLS